MRLLLDTHLLLWALAEPDRLDATTRTVSGGCEQRGVVQRRFPL